MHFSTLPLLFVSASYMVSAFPSAPNPQATIAKRARDFASLSYDDLERQYGEDFMDYVGWVPGVRKDAQPAATDNAVGGDNSAGGNDAGKGGGKGHKPNNGTGQQPQHPGKGGGSWRPLFNPSCCELDKTQAPIDLVGTLPAPSGQLSHVLLGRGTQNYTCDHSNDTAVPVAVGAVAHLYNASCIAASSPPFLKHLARWAFKQQVPAQDSAPLGGKDILTYTGRHFFTADGVPTFDLNSDGRVMTKKSAAVDAPVNALTDSVQWLFLTASPAMGQDVDGQKQSYSGVYRMFTAGGDPPTTCKGQKQNIEVQYAATYWFYK